MNDDEYAYQAQANLTQQQGELQASLYGNQLLEETNKAQAIILTESNPKNVTAEVILALQGREIRKGKTWQISQPLINNRGIERIRFILKNINQNLVLSYLMDERRIGMFAKKLADDLTDDLALNWVKYDIKDSITRDHIVDLVSFNFYFAMLRALGKNEKNWHRGIIMEFLGGLAKPMPPKQKGGFVEKFIKL